MKKEYAINRDGTCVGNACLTRQGLYYLVRCRCDGEQKERQRVLLRIGSLERDLGLCVPMDGKIGMDTRIPVKEFSDECVSFLLCSEIGTNKESFLPVRENEAFASLDRLMDARFAVRDSVPGVLLKVDQMEISRPTGQWSEPRT